MTPSDEVDGAPTAGERSLRVRFAILSPYVWAERRRLAIVGLLSVATAAMGALQPLPLKMLVDNGLGGQQLEGLPRTVFGWLALPDGHHAVIVVAAIASLLLALAATTLTSGSGLLWEKSGQAMTSRVMSDMFARLLLLSPRYHGRRTVGSLVSRISWDSQAAYAVVSGALFAPATNALAIVMIAATAWRLDPSLTLLMFAMAPVLAGVSIWFGPRLTTRAAASREDQSAVASFVNQVMHAMPVVQSFTGESRSLQQFRSLSKSAISSSRREAVVSALAGSFGQLIATLSSLVVLVVGGRLVLDGSMTLGALLAFVTYAQSLQRSAESVLLVYRAFRSAEAGVRRVRRVLEAHEVVPEPPNPTRFPGRSMASALVFERVDFAYEPGRPVLSDIDLVVDRGERVALVGRSGAGKTTLAGLIPRFFDPTAGRVLLDGVDLRHASVRDVRSRVSVVRQSSLLLPVSVAENIAYGRPGASAEAVRWAAREANADEFVEQLPNGYDTVLGELGATLSGGQRQRLAIARALLKDAPILVLDEPTSALDSESEALLVAAVERLAHERTVVVIAHRLSTIRRAGWIAVLDDGRLIEQGTHGSLVASNGHYAHLHRLQPVSVAP